MSQHKDRDEKPAVNEGRRKLVKAAAVAGGAVVAVAALPGEWKKPLATLGGLPAHGQTSDARIVVSNLTFLDLATRDVRKRVAIGQADCDWSVEFEDPLCLVGPDVTVSGTLTMCGEVTPFTATLQDLGAKIISGDSCAGVIQFTFPAGVCSNESTDGTLEIRLMQGDRQSNKISVSFNLPSWPGEPV
ncbi:MAG: hypothetical protein ACYC9Y_11020 [Candidatus Methylomirabilia bacterium]